MNVTVGTYNILHGCDYPHLLKTGEQIINLSSVSDAVRRMKLDICGLNEVRNMEKIGGDNQARVIAENLGYNYFFAKAIDYRGGEYGNALITKYPIVSAKVIPMKIPNSERIEGQSYEDRALLCADLLVDGKTLTVFVTHFGLGEDEQELAIKTIKEYTEQYDSAAVLMGDFNFPPSAKQYDELEELVRDTASFADGNTNTFPSDNPKQKIDYIFTNNYVETLSAEVPNELHSDHLPYVVKLNIG